MSNREVLSPFENITNLLSDDDMNKALSNYANKQYMYISDLNNQSYSNAQLLYDTTQISSDQWVLLREAYLTVPIRIESATATPLGESAIFAFKRSVLDIVAGVTVVSNGMTLVSDRDIQLKNYIDLVLEKTVQEQFTESYDLLFALDESKTLTTAVSPIPAPTNVVADNAGFSNRVKFIKSQCSFAAGVFKVMLQIPLRYIHSFFDMPYPVVNQPLQITFNLTTNTSGNFFFPLSKVSAGEDIKVSIDTSATYPESSVTQTSTRLYYPIVTYKPEVNRMISDKLRRGMTKTHEYRLSDIYYGGSLNNISTYSQYLVSPSVVAPTKLVSLLAPVNSVQAQAQPFIVDGQFRNSNVLLNNQPVFIQNLDSSVDIWNQLRQNYPSMVGQKGLVDFGKFLANCRYHVYDLTRAVDNNLSDPNASCSVMHIATLDSAVAGNFDAYFILERKMKVKFDFTRGSAGVQVGLNL
jgi:hypothetical protein